MANAKKAGVAPMEMALRKSGFWFLRTVLTPRDKSPVPVLEHGVTGPSLRCTLLDEASRASRRLARGPGWLVDARGHPSQTSTAVQCLERTVAHHKRRRPKNRRAGCLLCKPWKVNRYSIQRLGAERFSDHRRRVTADRDIIVAERVAC
jgi:hypothetical protein